MSLNRDPVLVDLALQGGGSHGAFTWGVLDRLLEEPWLKIDGISGTSAGAMNAAVLASGYAKGGPEPARKALDDFWRRVSDGALLSPLKRTPLDMLLGRWTHGYFARSSSPWIWRRGCFRRTTLTPPGSTPFDDILAACVDADELRKSSIKLFVTATNVHTGRGRVFRNAELTPDVLLASACLPTLFQAIEIDGQPYWDGGYSGNPTMTPLVRECTSQDTLIVAINPVERPGTPRSAQEIMNRLNEISFNATLLKELRMIALLRQAADPGHEEGAKWAGMRVHLVSSPIMTSLGYSSKLNAEWAFLTMLKEEGRRTADKFLNKDGNESWPAFDLEPGRSSGAGVIMGLCGILVALGVLIWLAYRGWSVLVLAPAAALVAAAFSQRAAARPLDADLHGQRRAIRDAVLPDFPARRDLWEAHGGQRVGRGHRALHDREAWSPARFAGGRACRGACHLWRRQSLRRFLRAGADGAGVVQGGRHTAAADASRNLARNLHFHHVGASRLARDPECDSRCRSSAPRLLPLLALA